MTADKVGWVFVVPDVQTGVGCGIRLVKYGVIETSH